MYSLLRKHKVFFAASLLAAVALRVLFIAKFKLIDGDSFVYGDIAKNWLTHGIFGVTSDLGADPTYIRLPGYPAFLAAIWRVTGLEHYTAVLIVQLLFDLGTCFIVADLTRRISSPRAAKIAFLLAALCPFTAVYVAAPLTEILAVFFAALALDLAVAGIGDLTSGRLRYWIASALAVAAGILTRPDGGILLLALGIYLLAIILRIIKRAPGDPHGDPLGYSRTNAVLAGVVLASVALAPLVPWTVRNWRDFHRFQPLAPRYANGPDEPVNEGFQRWIKTWIVDYISVVDVYWNFPGYAVDPQTIPSRAYDSEQERQSTSALLAEYNKTFEWTPELDLELGKIAEARIASHPVRYYVVLPALRIADMWFRPRNDLLRTNDRWWEYQSDPNGAFWAMLMGAINLFLVGAAVCSVFRRRELRYVGLLLMFVVVRSLFLGTLENPETRYTLECYPVVLALAATALAGKQARNVTAAADAQIVKAQAQP